ncbi:MAG: hypothetical protein FWD35_03885, partial [Oscillospiraceae bacterium]|nr:hypothetical protein [Oscillospiraceae bacterium]
MTNQDNNKLLQQAEVIETAIGDIEDKLIETANEDRGDDAPLNNSESSAEITIVATSPESPSMNVRRRSPIWLAVPMAAGLVLCIGLAALLLHVFARQDPLGGEGTTEPSISATEPSVEANYTWIVRPNSYAAFEIEYCDACDLHFDVTAMRIICERTVRLAST